MSRRILFTPCCTLDCPVDSTLFTGKRTTEIRPVSKRANSLLLEDNHIQSSVPHRDLEYLWIGKTRFQLRANTRSLATFHAGDTLDPEIFEHYGGDQFPSHWPDEKVARHKKYYKAIPEEFYSRPARKVIRPENCKAWLGITRSQQLRWQFQELCSGSGRLSLFLMLTGMMVAFPVDYRYGWDLSHPSHQKLLQECHYEFQPEHLFAAPSCGPWSVASANKAPDLREADRQAEMPMLHFLKEILFRQRNDGKGFTLEQPFGSAMLRHEPMVRLFDLEKVKKFRLDQCMLGAVDELHRPVKKTTALVSNRAWRQLPKRCNGHRGQEHGVLKVLWRMQSHGHGGSLSEAAVSTAQC